VRRRAPGERHADFGRHVADPVELGDIEAHLTGIDEFRREHAALN